MPKRRKKNIHDSKSAETCPCGCCKWHSSGAVRALLAIMFVLIVIAFAASLVFSSNQYFSTSILSFMGVIFLIVFIGWVFGFFCSCRGVHWSRHGFNMLDESRIVLKRRYANGEITKKQYESMMKDIE
ncbi:MAG: hypothetical protein ACREBH_03715 [Candidatus Micrarchaeaceae archaeon]